MTDYPIKVKIESGSAKPGRDEVVRLLSDIRDASKKTADSLDQIGKKGKKSMDEASKSGTILKNVLGSLFTLATVRQAILMADTYTNIQNRLRLVTTGTENLAAVTEELFRVSERTRSSFESTSELYSRLALSTKDLGISQKETMEFTESLNQAVILSGANAQEAAAGIIQLSQGMASGTLRGDELRSVLEQLPAVADVIAKGMGVTRGELRLLGQEGKITAKDIIDAFAQARNELAGKFATTVPTVGQAFVVLRNSVLETLGTFNQSYGITEGLAKVMLYLAKNMDTVVDVLTVLAPLIAASMFSAVLKVSSALGLLNATLLKSPWVWAATAIAALIVKVGGLQAAMIYLGVGFVAARAKIMEFLNTISGYAIGIVEGFGSAIQYVYDLLFEFGAGLNNFVNNPFGSGNFDGLKEKLKVGFVGSFESAFDAVQKETENSNVAIQDELNFMVDEAMNKIAKLKEEAKGSISGETGEDKTKKALTDADNQYLETKKSILENIIGPQREYTDSVRALNEYLAAGKINQEQYNEAMLQAEGAFLNALQPTDFFSSFTSEFRKMQLQTKDGFASMAKDAAAIFGPGGTLSKGIGDAVAQAIVFGKSWKESIASVAQEILTKLISSIVQIGVNMLINATLGKAIQAENFVQQTIMAKALAAAWYPAAIMASLATSGANAAGAQTGIATTAALGKIISLGGFEEGGYTGDLGTSQIAGVVHGKEFVVNAKATARNRSALEAMNSGKAPANNNTPNIILNNYAPGVEHSVNQLSNGDVEIIARRVVREDAPKVIASDLANPNSQTSKSLSQNTKTERKRV